MIERILFFIAIFVVAFVGGFSGEILAIKVNKWGHKNGKKWFS